MNEDNGQGIDFAGVLLIAGLIGIFIYKDLFFNKGFSGPNSNSSKFKTNWLNNKKFYM